MSDHIIKLVIAGDGGVGKTTLLNRYIHDKFESETKLTKGLEFFSKNININDKTYELVIWDLGGQTQFKKLFAKSKWIEGTLGALVLFDLTRFNSLNNIYFWLDLLDQQGDIPILIVGSKLDMTDGDTKNIDDVVLSTLEVNDNYFDYIKTSSLTGENVNESFELLIRKIMSK
ncbi:MAG: GTP-binding protein [Promethearchaeota archaeon]|nr:MAG: GTP-binding protein [Candidatus Lokiarchaeota archaeon]